MAYIPLESWSANLGKSVGSGLTEALANIAKDKVTQINKENFRKQWGEQGAGYKPNEVDLLWESRQNPAMAKGFSTLLGAFGPGAGQQLQQEQAQHQPQSQQQAAQQSAFMQQPEQQFNARQAIAQNPAYSSLFGQPNASAALMQNPAIAQLMGMRGLDQGQMPNATRQLGLDRLPAEQMQERRPMQAGAQQALPAQMAQMAQPQQYSPMGQYAPQEAPMSDRQRYAQEIANKGKAGAIDEKKQAAIDRSQAPYIKSLDTKLPALREIVEKAGNMKRLLEEGGDDQSRVASGWTGAIPSAIGATRVLGSASEQFANNSDDVAAALTALSTGVQTISKIKFNQQRKPNLGQNRLTQEERTDELINWGKKGLLEEDLRNYLVESNSDRIPENLSGKVKKQYDRLQNSIPPIPSGSSEGQIFNDPKNKVQWRVEGPILRFNGFIGE